MLVSSAVSVYQLPFFAPSGCIPTQDDGYAKTSQLRPGDEVAAVQLCGHMSSARRRGTINKTQFTVLAPPEKRTKSTSDDKDAAQSPMSENIARRPLSGVQSPSSDRRMRRVKPVVKVPSAAKRLRSYSCTLPSPRSMAPTFGGALSNAAIPFGSTAESAEIAGYCTSQSKQSSYNAH